MNTFDVVGAVLIGSFIVLGIATMVIDYIFEGEVNFRQFIPHLFWIIALSIVIAT